MFDSYYLKRSQTAFKYQKGESKDSIFLLDCFLNKFPRKKNKKEALTPLKFLNLLNQNIFFSRIKKPGLVKKNPLTTKRTLEQIKMFYFFSNFIKLQFSYYFFEKLFFEFLRTFPNQLENSFNSLVVNKNLKNSKSNNLNSPFCLSKFLQLKKSSNYHLESFVTVLYLDRFLQQISSKSRYLVKSHIKKVSFVSAFLSESIFDLSNVFVIFSFDILKKQSEFFIHVSHFRKTKTYWLSFVSIFENFLFKNFSKITFILNLLISKSKNFLLPTVFVERKNKKLADYQSKKREFYFYKSSFYSVLDYFFHHLNFPFYRFSKSKFSDSKLLNRAFQILMNPNFLKTANSNNDQFVNLISLFIGVDFKQIENKRDELLLSKILNLVNEQLNNQKRFFIYFDEKTLQPSQFLARNHFSTLKLPFFHFQKMETFLFDKLKKSHLSTNPSKYYSLSPNSIFLKKFYLNVKPAILGRSSCLVETYKKQVFVLWNSYNSKLFSYKLLSTKTNLDILNQDVSNAWLVGSSKLSSHFTFLNFFSTWLKKNNLTFFKIQLFSTVLELKSRFSGQKFHFLNSCRFRLFYSTIESYSFKNSNLYYAYQSFGIFTIFANLLKMKAYMKSLKKVIKQNSSTTQEFLIYKLNSKILAYSYYSYFILRQRMFKHLDKELLRALWKWALRRHNNKNQEWIQKKYFFNVNKSVWIFGSLFGFHPKWNPLALKRKPGNAEVRLVYLPYHAQMGSLFYLII